MDGNYGAGHGADGIQMLDYAEEEEVILNTDEEVEIQVAADTGAVAHCVGPDDLPGSTRVEKKEGNVRNFVGANNSPIKHYVAARVRLELGDDRHIQNEFQVADVCRPLHSISTVTDEGFDVLFRKGEGTVVPA